MTTSRKHTLKQHGFTLVEAVIVMVVTGVLAGVMVLFIRQPVQNYVDAAGRAELSDTADLALRRMARELRGALPNSIRTNFNNGVWYVQFIPAKAGGQYLAVEDNPTVTGATPLSFTSTSAKSFNIVGPLPVGAAAIVPNTDYIVIYNLGNGIAGADAYDGGNIAQVAALNIVNLNPLLTMTSNPFALAATPNASPGHRFNVVNTPVTFRCEGRADGTGTLARIEDGAFASTQPQPAVGGNPLLAANVQECDFSAAQAGSLHSALIGMTLSLARPRAGGAANGLETVTLVHQIHVDNTP
ncbi:MSHA biogenesis protein MshO [Duganella sp. CF402]|uniref:type II secretion system protein n=1 Tax=unclassified Duganella TaxID=2636909 RepID=UPI0008B70C77|nr:MULTISPECIES: type II secretion system protein [unclassified Duganella]RZT10793.1 MSHA biogenesis protein MshO [Duganella sp. BK701]SEK96274.1 MSHA biogenesis protein MshO [Duganella sp. CF402]